MRSEACASLRTLLCLFAVDRAALPVVLSTPRINELIVLPTKVINFALLALETSRSPNVSVVSYPRRFAAEHSRSLLLAAGRVEMILGVTLQFVRQAFLLLIQAGGIAGRPIIRFREPSERQSEADRPSFSKAWIARVRPFFSFSIKSASAL